MSITELHQLNTQPYYRRATIGPDWAKQILASNDNNRHYNPESKNARQLRSALTRGEWQFNGDAIRIDRTGRLIDGQHRLNAVVQTGIPIDTMIIDGLEPEAQVTMDTGKKRTTRDYLTMRGEKSVAVLSAVLSRCLVRDKYGLEQGVIGSTYPQSISEELAYLESHPHLREITKETARLQSINMPLQASLTGYLLDTFRAIDKEDADFFMQRLADGVGLAPGSPILALRTALRKNNESRRNKLTARHLAALTVKAWNKFRTGEEVTLLVHRAGGAHPEKFPEAI